MVEVRRPLTAEDLLKLEAERGTRAPPLKALRDSHHAVCRCLATGMSETETAIVCGTTVSRISVLKADPAFQDLLAFYRREAEAKRQTVAADFFTRAVALQQDALEELRDRLHDSPGEFAVGDLMDLTKLLADRTGNGPQTKSTNVNVNVNLADRLRLARQRVGAGAPDSSGVESAAGLLPSGAPQVIDHE